MNAKSFERRKTAEFPWKRPFFFFPISHEKSLRKEEDSNVCAGLLSSFREEEKSIFPKNSSFFLLST
jgi:hypothetical protein